MNTQRRTFRGRGGPNDRRLPKHNARRRKNEKQASRPAFNKYEEEDAEAARAIKEIVDKNEHCDDDHDDDQSHDDSGSNHNISQDDDNGDDGDMIIVNDATQPIEAQTETTNTNNNNNNNNNNNEPPDEPWRIEMKHLRKRVKNVQESIQLSSNSISNPTTYNQNVLNAVLNSVNEWRSIIVHHYKDVIIVIIDENDHPPITTCTEEETMIKETSLAVFMLIQLALQSGPLAGSKPGYFKRCGGEVAKVVLVFLKTVMELIDDLRFTEKQIAALGTWQSNAQKAAENDKPPSKSALKKQKQQQQQQQQSKKKKKNTKK